jgi:small-conductance mechanosensitive channel
MFSNTLFHLGPYAVCIWNFIFIGIICFFSVLLRRVIHRNLKRLLTNQNIRVEGRRATLLRLLSQTVYILSAYLGVLSFNYNNVNVSFFDFLSYELISNKYFILSFAHILGILAILFAARMLVNFVKLFIIRRIKGKTDLDAGTEFVYIQVAKYLIYIVAVMICLRILEVNLAVFLTGSAALLVGVGIGLQDVFRDLISGIILLVEGKLKVGDIVEIFNAGSNESMVARIIKINVRTTQIETRNGNSLIVPNNKLTQEYIENWSHGSPMSRFNIGVSVAYGSDTELVKRLLKKAAMGHPHIDRKEEILIRLINFGDNGLEMDIIFWAEQSWDVNMYKSDIRFEIDRLFREHNIIIPFPQRDLHVVGNAPLFESK